MTTTERPEASGSTMLYVSGIGYINAKSADKLGYRGDPAYEIVEPETTTITKPRKKALPKADNDNPVIDIAEAARELSAVVDEQGDWTPPPVRVPRGQPFFRYGLDGPSIDMRLDAQAARLTSNRYRGQAANDNKDWPLGKQLRAENNDHCLALAERYRDMWQAANMPCDIVGRDLADNVYLMHRTDLDASTGKLADKGLKKVKGKKARLDMPAKRAVAADPDKTKQRAKPMPKKWNGDWPLLHHIDASRELAAVQGALGWLREGFEAAVCHGETLEAIGRNHGAGNKKGAAGGGRVLVYLGLQCIDEFWSKPARRAA
jgi:hypothetical protein